MSEAPETSTATLRQTAPGFGSARVLLKPRKAQPFFGRHPWVLDSAVQSVEGQPADGDVVELITDKDRFIARGVYNSRSRIRVRLFTWNASEALDANFWRGRISAAIAWRKRIGYDNPLGAARVVFSEADGLSGLIIDRYGEYLVVQPTGLALYQRFELLVPILVDLLHPKGIFLRGDRGMAQIEGIEFADHLAWGEAPEGPIFIEENGLRIGIDLREGQKTGYYLDQRENRKVAATYLRDVRVLDMFCYSGGFSLAASALGHAKEVVAVDGSEKALALARANAQLNELSNIQFEKADGFDFLAAQAASGQKFDAVILDPPKFARSRGGIDEALKAYHRLNRLALETLVPGGILVTCSCSGHVTRDDFLMMLVGVAQKTERTIQVIEQRGAAPDHPVAATCLESEYLKCFICRVG